MSDDDRQLRDELEKVQSEVLHLKRALEKPEGLHADLRARVDALRRSRQQQQAKLDEVNAQAQQLDDQLRAIMAANDRLQGELDGLLANERGLVDATVRTLDPGPRSAGCVSALALAAALAVVGWLT